MSEDNQSKWNMYAAISLLAVGGTILPYLMSRKLFPRTEPVQEKSIEKPLEKIVTSDSIIIPETNITSDLTNKFTNSEKDLFTLLDYYEGAFTDNGEKWVETPYDVRLAICYSVINRFNHPRKMFGETLQDIMLKSKQYSCFNGADLSELRRVVNKKVWDNCKLASEEAMNGKDSTNGATHYVTYDRNTKKLTNGLPMPYWTYKLPLVHTIDLCGNREFRFYKEK